MARKSARAVAAAEANPQPANDVASSSKVPLSALSPKSCLTCGRVITPRAKWAKDWSGIKYCSERCRSTRPGKIVVEFSAEIDPSDLRGCTGATCENGGELKVDIEKFVEGVLSDVASRKGGGTLEDVQDRIKNVLKSASIETGGPSREANDSDADHGDLPTSTRADDGESRSSGHPLWEALDSPPGLRERIRRAARRLALGLAHASDPQQTEITTTHAGSIELSQSGKVLRTVQDLSFAKGALYVKSRKP